MKTFSSLLLSDFLFDCIMVSEYTLHDFNSYICWGWFYELSYSPFWWMFITHILEKQVYYAVVEHSMSIRSGGLVVYFFHNLADFLLSGGSIGYWKGHFQLSVESSQLYEFVFLESVMLFCLMYFEALLFGGYTFKATVSSGWIHPFSHYVALLLSLVIFFALMSIYPQLV